MRYFVEITIADKEGYIGCTHHGNSANIQSLSNLRLLPDVEITIKGQAYTLDTLLQTLIGYAPHKPASMFDERGQLEIGQYLYTQTFGHLQEDERQRLHKADEVDVRIIT